ncbi:hypothetical protein EDD15DRAFT_2203667 [Pisolithus albus]|nr:hypothetical protein EDD15DRAFT_2203667 [Pisolithus albus]
MSVTITKLSSDGESEIEESIMVCSTAVRVHLHPDASVHEREEPAIAHSTFYVPWDELLRDETATEHVKESRSKQDNPIASRNHYYVFDDLPVPVDGSGVDKPSIDERHQGLQWGLLTTEQFASENQPIVEVCMGRFPSQIDLKQGCSSVTVCDRNAWGLKKKPRLEGPALKPLLNASWENMGTPYAAVTDTMWIALVDDVQANARGPNSAGVRMMNETVSMGHQ